MLTERDYIEIINKVMKQNCSCTDHGFETDATQIEISDSKLLFSMDNYSEEDLLRENDPYSMGWNLAAGSISDIYAAGGIPKYFGHSMSVSQTWDEKYVEKFTLGIANVLQKTDTIFMGGDLSKAKKWKYTASVIGTLAGNPLTRKGAKAKDIIYITGKIGIGNLEAAFTLFSDKKISSAISNKIETRYKLHSEKAKLVRKYGTACIDTSDGTFNSLNILSEINSVGYVIDNLPIHSKGILFAKLVSLPKELLFLGECGEYELLFTIDQNDEESFLKEAKEQRLVYHRLGRVVANRNFKKLITKQNAELNLSEIQFRARDFENVKDYLKAITNSISKQRM